jgi:hypothetical protein
MRHLLFQGCFLLYSPINSLGEKHPACSLAFVLRPNHIQTKTDQFGVPEDNTSRKCDPNRNKLLQYRNLYEDCCKPLHISLACCYTAATAMATTSDNDLDVQRKALSFLIKNARECALAWKEPLTFFNDSISGNERINQNEILKARHCAPVIRNTNYFSIIFNSNERQ